MKTQNDILPLENKGNIKLAGQESCYQWIGTADIQVLYPYSEVVKTAKSSLPTPFFYVINAGKVKLYKWSR